MYIYIFICMCVYVVRTPSLNKVGGSTFSKLMEMGRGGV